MAKSYHKLTELALSLSLTPPTLSSTCYLFIKKQLVYIQVAYKEYINIEYLHNSYANISM